MIMQSKTLVPMSFSDWKLLSRSCGARVRGAGGGYACFISKILVESVQAHQSGVFSSEHSYCIAVNVNWLVWDRSPPHSDYPSTDPSTVAVLVPHCRDQKRVTSDRQRRR